MRIFIIVASLIVMLFFATDSLAGSRGGHRGGYKGSYKSSSKLSSGKTHVRGYTKKTGTYVSPHYRTRPNRTKSDNWSSKGNVNPYTGKKGTK